MKAVVLAAGEGTRLRPFTVSRPKVMIPVGNRPVLFYVIRALVQNGIKDLVLVVGYKRERIMSYFGDGSDFGANITYVMQEKQIGTAHALKAAEKSIDSDFLVVAGDNLIDANSVADLVNEHKGFSILVTTSETPSKYGVVKVEGGKVVSIVEKPEKKIGNVISTGMYRFTPEIFDLIDASVTRGEFTITDVIRQNLSHFPFKAVQTSGAWCDAVYPWDLIKVNAAALDIEGQDVSATVESGVTLKGPVTIGPGSRIRSGCYIEGPVVIGEGCDIGPFVTILPATSIGSGVQVEPYSFISESLIMNNVRIGSHSHLSRSVVDDGVAAGPGLWAPCAAATIRVDSEHFQIENIGAMVGQDATIGSGVSIEPGTVVGAGCRIRSSARVSGNLENRSIVV
jgi:UDP-N-acetylglucosamine diphosphorylase/glucosamine-1-phosphate N-acetyltransferase